MKVLQTIWCWMSVKFQVEFSIKDFFSKCDQIRRKLWIWSNLLKKCLKEKLHFLCSVSSVKFRRHAQSIKFPLQFFNTFHQMTKFWATRIFKYLEPGGKRLHYFERLDSVKLQHHNVFHFTAKKMVLKLKEICPKSQPRKTYMPRAVLKKSKYV